MDRPPRLIVDAGPIWALVDRRDRYHAAAKRLFSEAAGPLVVPVLVIGEVMHFVGKQLDTRAELMLLRDFSYGHFLPEPVHPADWVRIAELVARYRDLRLGTVDASVIAAAERLDVRAIATFDRRHFSVVRPAHVDAFELLPD